MEKICGCCKIELEATLDNFHSQKKGKFGLNSICKKCIAIKNKILRSTDKYKEKAKLKQREWVKKNYEKSKEINKKSRDKNKEKYYEIKKEKYRNDLEYKQKCLDREAKYKASGRRHEMNSKLETRIKARKRSADRRKVPELKEHDYKRARKWREENKDHLVLLHKRNREQLSPSYVAQSMRISVNDLDYRIYETKKIIISLKRELKNNNVKIR